MLERGRTCSLTAGQSGETEGKVLEQCLESAKKYIQEQLSILIPQEIEYSILQGKNAEWEVAGTCIEVEIKMRSGKSDGRISCILRIRIEKEVRTEADFSGQPFFTGSLYPATFRGMDELR